jgi:hypothetical protein
MATLNQSGFSFTNFAIPRQSDKNVTKVCASMINMTNDDNKSSIPGKMQRIVNVDNKPHNKIIKDKAVAIFEDHLSSHHCWGCCDCWEFCDIRHSILIITIE